MNQAIKQQVIFCLLLCGEQEPCGRFLLTFLHGNREPFVCEAFWADMFFSFNKPPFFAIPVLRYALILGELLY
jgi:hypothetical protein